MGIEFLWIAIILMAAKLSSFINRYGFPDVMGELLVGILFGNLSIIGIQFFEPLRTNIAIGFLAELGVVILLFQIGMESSLSEILKVGSRALLVACAGILMPFSLGFLVIGPFLFPRYGFHAYLFLGAVLTATSVGVTARIFSDFGRLNSPEARIVLSAAVIDDILGLTILGVSKAIVTSGSVDITGIILITVKAVGFMAGALWVGLALAPKMGRFLSAVNPGTGMKFIMAISFGLTFAYVAERIGLAPIVGAFAAGLILKPVSFKHFERPKVIDEINEQLESAEPKVRNTVHEILYELSDHHMEEMIKPLSYFLVPIFFVYTGMSVKLEYFLKPQILILAAVITAAAIIGKLFAGLFAGKANKLVVGWGLVPRGEVAVIFALAGKALGVIPDDLYSMIIIMVIITTLIVPMVLKRLIVK